MCVALKESLCFSMSTLVDKAIRLYKAEELKVTETIRLHKELLLAMRTRVKVSSEAETPASVNDQDISLKDRQEVELLEQVLKKALKIRSTVGLNVQENPSGYSDKAPAVNDGDQRNAPKSSLQSYEVKGSRRCEGQLKSNAGRGTVATRQVPVKAEPSSRHTVRGKQSGMKPFSRQKATGGSVQTKPCQVTSCRNISVGSSSLDKRTSYCNHESEMQSETSAQWLLSPSLPSWQAQQTKKNKLWNKVVSGHSNPVPERDRFKKRLISIFPKEWSSGHIAAMEADLDALTQFGLDLSHCYNAELQSYEMGWSPEKEYESLLLLVGLEKMMVQTIKEAGRLKKDWERKMAWWHEDLCPLRRRLDWHSSERPCIPSLLAYSSKGELEDLQSLRLHVAQLKLEIHAHQAICDALINQTSSAFPSSGRPSASALRGVYSLLGEGGVQFPSLVVDNDSAEM